jgi:hypothetical protein
VSTADHASVIAANAAADKIEAVIVIEATFERCPLAHKSAPSLP